MDSPKKIIEFKIAIGITRLFETASLYELTFVAPIFHNKNPIPVAHSPKNNRASKLISVNWTLLSEMKEDSIHIMDK